jgi:hypothetical protein
MPIVAMQGLSLNQNLQLDIITIFHLQISCLLKLMEKDKGLISIWLEEETLVITGYLIKILILI